MLKCPCFGDFPVEDALRTIRDLSDMARRCSSESLVLIQKGRALVKEMI
jgi:hypothetical protein